VTPEEALGQIAVEGEMACDHFNDSGYVLGWFGWDIVSGTAGTAILAVTYEHGENGDADAELVRETFQWELRQLP
jgi:hypothetical protein